MTNTMRLKVSLRDKFEGAAIGITIGSGVGIGIFSGLVQAGSSQGIAGAFGLAATAALAVVLKGKWELATAAQTEAKENSDFEIG